MTIRTRFAPSPTGYMHIGGMRTALFNWLWARHNGGQFILRIDDTDQERNIDAALGPILDAFRWLGLDWDEGPEVGGPHGPYFQSQRLPLYHRVCDELIAAGKAYKDFDPPALSQEDRQAAEKEKRPYLNIRRSLELTDLQRADLENAGTPYVVRFLVDRTRKVAIDDHVRGHVEWDCGLIADPVIMRGNGMPLYNFASVVDDCDLKISHIIRAEEHLTNTAVQALLFEALGGAMPEFAHIPFVAAPGTKEKLSKREKNIEKYRKSPQFKKLFDIADDVLPKLGLGNSQTLNPVMVAYYEAVGFLPEAVLNALSRLGWSYDDKTENMSLDFVVKNFTLDRIVKAPAGLDPDKLLSYQEYWISQLSLDEKIDGCLPYLLKAGLLTEQTTNRAELGRIITALGDRLKLFSDLLSYPEYFVEDDQLDYDEAAFDKRIRKPERARELLAKYEAVLDQSGAFDAATLESEFKAWMEQSGISYGDIIHALRLAVSGKTAGPGMFECLELLGRERCLKRIEIAIARADENPTI
ncbi:glutamate--tRNA ligase [Planctomicrobium piriforme]|uniref:Glutamate--tRNA ligase n=1 Tax=Planctomicrobium piriforme TaxID=1576369 RepID=A0A1I3MTA1_9PLAN|nr:glutamate--tRNA ligase family protein [Planctomicrobium piriforme]SFJ00334.1 glutamyl-tRNA synthetase [Planctomicrobium piriforme]